MPVRLGNSVRAGLFTLLMLLVAPPASGEDPPLETLVERVARAAPEDAEVAADLLVERVVGPLTRAIGSIESRPLPEQVRLHDALGRVHAAIRMRVFRAGLPEEEQAVFDRFLKQSSRRVERLFHESADERYEALRRLPLDADSGVGVLLVAKVFDSDMDVMMEALKRCGQLRDRYVISGLGRSLREINQYFASGLIDPDDEFIEIALADSAEKAIRAMGVSGVTHDLPTLFETTRNVLKSRARGLVDLGVFAEALGAAGDERAAPLLLEFLDDIRPRLFHPARDGGSVSQTDGDVALIALLQIYDLPASAFGLEDSVIRPPLTGYTSWPRRRAGHQAFRDWHRSNADKPLSERSRPPASQPAEDTNREIPE